MHGSELFWLLASYVLGAVIGLTALYLVVRAAIVSALRAAREEVAEAASKH